ncbi:methionine--tRNA ligase [Candidatus Pacearchaeota archaeon]|nr:MAG: methionine--tRNA ligase [Candidatus Pacearchaeota archaeon]
MAKGKFYVTTAIDYVNAEPHIGHAYQKIAADVLARWHRLLGKDVYFLTGTDEHGKKVQRAAEAQGKTPKEFVDEISEKFKEAWEMLNIKPDRFIRTTDPDHEKVVKEFILKCNENGDIYKGKYEGLYCVDCEAYYTEKDAPNLECPVHKRPLEKLSEESYFFRLSKYRDFLLELYEKHPEFVLPEKRRNEVIKRVQEGLKDFSITRTSFDWGIEFPLDKSHVVYVWFDALINYYTATRANGLEKFWPADAHLLGKDNTWFHCVYWPAMLKSAGIELPKTVFNHGFLSFNGQKISKSLGNAISIKTLVEKYGADSIRYFVLRQIPFASGDDGDFSEKALVERHNNELADKLGNLVLRVSALVEKYGIEKTEVKELNTSQMLQKVSQHMERFEFDKALADIFFIVDLANEFVQKEKPWETQSKEVLYEALHAIRDVAILLSPFIPEACEKIARNFNFTLSLEEFGKPLANISRKKSEVLFRKI